MSVTDRTEPKKHDRDTPTAKRKRRKKKALSPKQSNATSQKAQQAVVAKEKQLFSASQDWLRTGEALTQEIDAYTQTRSRMGKKKARVLAEMQQLVSQTKDQMSPLTDDFAKVSRVSAEELAQAHPQKQTSTNNQRWVGNLIFSVFLLVLIVVLSLGTGNQGSQVPRNIGGYAPMTILTGSMESVYPKHSFVLAKVIDPQELRIGDDITYLKENNTTVTHRIVGIDENYLGTNRRGFETKGIENPRKDEEIVRGENVIGKIVYASVTIGTVIRFVRENMVLTAVILILIIWLSDALLKYIKIKKRGETT